MRVLGPTTVEVSGRTFTSFAGTNYLGLSFHPRILEALAMAVRSTGFGLGASRKTTGNTDEVVELERRTASFTGADAALVTTSGTLANAGVLEGLRGAIDHWLIDSEAHPSFTSFLPLSGAQVHRYRHLDTKDLARQFSALKGRVGIFTDTVFALTGEIAPLDEIERVTGDALLVFDEAHALGVIGPGISGKAGRGCVANSNLYAPRTIVTGTFSKALGCVGGVILGPAEWLRWIREHSALLASTSALSPSLSVAAMTALDVLKDEPERLTRLHANIDLMRDLLGLPGRSPSAPIFSSQNNSSQNNSSQRNPAEVAQLASEAGFLVPLMSSYPGTPQGGMLRWIVSSEHTETDIRTVSAILSRL
jgi:8-amino-7-oxononanoate synthase